MQDRRMDLVTLRSERLQCSINPLGAELQRLTGDDDREWLWDGNAAYWSGRAPILFPIVGMLAEGVYRWQGRPYALEKHGFARRRAFAVVERTAASATLRLSADHATRQMYPFDFELELRFVLTNELTITATVRNRGEEPMPFSFGFHPALRWPRAGEAQLLFDARESGPVWRIDGNGLIARKEPLPGDGRRMVIDDALFVDDAMILRDVASRAICFEHDEGIVRVVWDNLPDLGLWTKPGAPFLCVEPWAGFSDPVGFVDDISEKPGIVILDRGSDWSATITIAPL